MSKNKFYSYIFIIFLTVVCLGFLWEFWLESPVMRELVDDFNPESTAEHWEHVVTLVFLSCIALIYPTVMGGKLIAKQQEDYDKIKRLSERDYLTGFYNRRKFIEELGREVSRCARYGHPFSTIMLDIDEFKHINDEFGHIVGDQVLAEISEVVRSTVRASDIVGRWGGEEFIVLCPETRKGGAYALAEKLRKRIAGHEFGIVYHKTVSLGVAEFEADDDIESIVIKADRALYSAKREGKNRAA